MSECVSNVYIALTQDENPPNISQFIITRPEYKDVKWIHPQKNPQITDWRDLAMKEAMAQISSEYVLFLEQDFLIKDQFVLNKIIDNLDTYDFIYYQEGERIHPAFFLTKTNNVRRSSMDFGAHPPEHDHFGGIVNSMPYENKADLKDLGFWPDVDFYHIAGLTQNYHVYKMGQAMYKMDEFLTYNSGCLKLEMTQEPMFYSLCEEIERVCGVGQVDKIKQFFI